jgi:hypothetical protein
MRSATLILLATTLVLVLAIGSAQADKAEKVKSQVEIEWYGFDGGYFLFGDVHSKKNKCERNREVTVKVAGQSSASGTTDRTGDWSVPIDLDFNEPFVASVEKRAVGKGGKKLVCKAADSPPFVIEP